MAKLSADLSAALSAAASIRGKLPAWASPAVLPPIAVPQGCLDDGQTTVVLKALAKSSLAEPDPLVPCLHSEATAGSLDDFAWGLFGKWLIDGAPAKEKWALFALGLFGGDQSAIDLATMVREWPGQGKHKMAVLGLECLKSIGTDTALQQINGIAQKVKFHAIKERAHECMELMAAERKLTRQQLEDRVVPDCGLDQNGSRVFDFGPRQFRLVLGADGKPLIVDSENRSRPDLPKPNTKDDLAKAEEGIAAWKLMKRQLAESLKIQTRRLEEALVTQRRWSSEEFDRFLLRHLLMMNLARYFVWGAYCKDGKLAATFRVTDDGSLADEHDSLLGLPGGVSIGLAHPIHLPEASLAAWGEVFSDYEILPPFAQLGRPILRLTSTEEAGDTLYRHPEVRKIPAVYLVSVLERLGWERGLPLDGGGYQHHGKHFAEAGVTAVVEHATIYVGSLDDSPPTTITECYFTAGPFDRWSPRYSRLRKLPLRLIDPLIVSEVLGNLQTVASTGG